MARTKAGSFAAALAVLFTIGTAFLGFLRVVQRGMEAPGPHRHLTDFDDSWVVGRMALQGAARAAYDHAALEAAMRQMLGRTVFLPWAYPPPYDLLAAGLAMLSPAAAYGVFIGVTGAAYLLMLRALGRGEAAVALLVAAPAVYMNVLTGQNGLMSAALAGGFTLAFLARREAAGGIALGALVLKPHLALGLGVLALARGRWRLLAVAVGMAAALAAAATLAFGTGIWAAFRAGAGEIAGFLAEGRMPLWRFVSAYASLRTAGLPAGAALAGQGAVALAALGLVAWGARRLAPRPAAGLALLATLAVSPYAYDYDLALLGPAAALLLPELRARAGTAARAGMLALAWAAALTDVWPIRLPGVDPAAPGGLHYAAPGGLLLGLLIAAVAATLAHPPRPGNAAGAE